MSEEPEMSYREKTAWIFLITTVLVSGFLLLHVPWTLQPRTSPTMLHGILLCSVVWRVMQGVARLIVARLAPEDAKAPKDEREQLIELKAIRIARLVYILGSLLAVLTLHIGATGPAVGYLVMFALVLGELANYSARIVFHRRGM